MLEINCIGIKWLQMSEEIFFYVEKVKIFYDVRKEKNLCIIYKYLIFLQNSLQKKLPEI